MLNLYKNASCDKKLLVFGGKGTTFFYQRAFFRFFCIFLGKGQTDSEILQNENILLFSNQFIILCCWLSIFYYMHKLV